MADNQAAEQLLRWIHRAFTPVTAASLQKAVLSTGSRPAGPVPPRVWIVWSYPPLHAAGRQVELVTADEQRAMRLASSSPRLVAEALDVEDTGDGHE